MKKLVEEIIAIKHNALNNWASKAINEEAMDGALKFNASDDTKGILQLFFSYIYGPQCLKLDWIGFRDYFEKHHADLQSDFNKVVGNYSSVAHLSDLLAKKSKIKQSSFEGFAIGVATWKALELEGALLPKKRELTEVHMKINNL